ncbi:MULTISPECIES: class 1 fructose-bisphosphatase [Rhodobacterales]|jgi:fructose-1,6-bisphosphatase I|uniref:class 1 fructose-bisphosphatase n=1 Tax=Rhodobacterales TaxID=204455 RepID=UPI00237FB82D|nr:class 1 fructose-bisphosphatase [Phaeobacter gallaeciensis]MDE4096646.1 class 1 fructose-bisphosphatase [Phaeobacter gallaeciensis]MDE4105457.1 class 1 fructose-bisphosphatase [Phaeobacter gallaeciensis]MDE4109913.1 class 1 fructose-bisphosphatase [Phaeobacter gallaeciensis]MDE4114381.1 class 1 fructose-bisphosphatase [Phaeobacter gallaeciensis]MDE4118848.1 class 1 fructose-bisphosphatase [Phaeobacter gallaeciensis]
MKILDEIPQGADTALVAELDRLAGVAASLARRIARGGIDENLGGAAGTNTDGDAQKALDVIADEAFMEALAQGDVRHYASEEQDSVVTMNPEGQFAVAIDPLDGSSNIDTNVSIGTIFGIYPAAETPEASFLRPGHDLLAAGYAIFGPQCALMVTLGDGVWKYVLDPETGQFHLLGKLDMITPDSREYAINTSNYRHWGKAIRAYIDDRVAGSDGPARSDFNMRWIASLVAETHRILTRGGIFLYPADNRKGYGQGRLRYVYECAPIAMLIEQAGGRATDGLEPILDRVPDALHMRTPFVFGSANKVARVATYHDLPDEETSALFGLRGLFRA